MKTKNFWVWLSFLLFPSILTGQCLEPLNESIPKSNYEICFINKNKGWRAYRNGEVYTTNDQGKNWELIATLPEKNLGLKILFIDKDTGFISGTFGVYMSSDGGLNWDLKPGGSYRPPLYDKEGRLYFLQKGKLMIHDFRQEEFYTITLEDNRNRQLTFYEPGRGYLFSGDDAFINLDEGVLTDTAFIFLEGDVSSFYFLNENLGYVLTSNSDLYRTEDRGQHWDFITSFDEEGLSGLVTKMNFQNEMKAVIHLNGRGKILRTDNGWVTWDKQSIPGRNLYPINFCEDGSTWYHDVEGYSFLATSDFFPVQFKDFTNHSDNQYLAIVNDSIIMTAGYFLTRSTDNGKTFQIDSNFLEVPCTGLDFPDPNFGYLVRNDTLYFSNDLGRSWEKIWISNNGHILYFQFLDKEKGYIHLNSGEILKTLDSGRTWSYFARVSPSVNAKLTDFFDEQHFAVVDGTELYFSRNWGASLTLTDFSNYGRINDIKWLNSERIVLLFDNWVVWYSVFGGANVYAHTDLTYDYLAVVQDYSVLFDNNGNVGFLRPGMQEVINFEPFLDYNIFCNGFLAVPDGRVLVGGNNGFLGNFKRDKECRFKLPDYFQDSILAGGTLVEWEDTTTCSRFNIVSWIDQNGDYIINDSIVLGNQVQLPNTIVNQAFTTLEIGFVSLWDTTYCFSKQYQNPDCRQTISKRIKVCDGQPFIFRGNTYGLGLHSIFIDGEICDTTFFFQVVQENPVAQSTTIHLCLGDIYFRNGNSYTQPFSFIDTILSSEGCDSIYLTTSVTFEEAIAKEWTNWESELRYNHQNLFFLNENIAYTSDSDDDIYKSEDGGITWEEITSFQSIHIKEIFFLSEDLGWVLAKDNLLYKIKNDGMSRDTIPLPTLEMINSIHFINEQIGFAIGVNGHISKTIDGGQTWQKQDTPEDAILFGEWFFDENEGFVFGREGSLNYTNNGGETWTIRFPYYNNIEDLKFLNRDTGFAIANNSVIVTLDRGLSWEVFPWEEGGIIRQGAFQSNGAIIVYTSNEEIFISRNFCQSWELMTHDPTTNIQAWFTDNHSYIWFTNYFNDIYKYGPTNIQCPQNILSPVDSNQLISVNQEFAWAPVYPCVDGFNIDMGLGNNPINLVKQKDIGYNTTFQFNRLLPFDTTVLLSINPYIIEGDTYTCPPLTFRTCPFIGDTMRAEICYGESFEFRGNTYTNDTQVFWAWSLPNGCDSFIVLDLKVHNPNFTTIDTTLSPADVFHGITLQNDTTFQQLFTNQYGCDSLVTYTINVDRSSVKNTPLLTGLKVFPNPTSGKLMLQIPGSNTTEIEIFITNQLGQKIKSVSIDKLLDNRIEIALPPSLGDGLYYVKIRTTEGFYLEKINLSRN